MVKNKTIIIYERRSPMDDIFRPRKIVVPPDPRLFAFGESLQLLTASAAIVASLGIVAGIIPMSSTVSYFNDSETSSGAALQASELDFTVSPASFDGDVGPGAGDASSASPGLAIEGYALPFIYTISTEKTGGSDALCNALSAYAWPSPFNYSGPLLSLLVENLVDAGSWQLEVTLPSSEGVGEGDVCNVDLVYSARHQEAPNGTGYQDEERIAMSFTAHTPAESEEQTITSLEEPHASQTATGPGLVEGEVIINLPNVPDLPMPPVIDLPIIALPPFPELPAILENPEVPPVPEAATELENPDMLTPIATPPPDSAHTAPSETENIIAPENSKQTPPSEPEEVPADPIPEATS